MNHSWQHHNLTAIANAWLIKIHKRTSALVSENSSWWSFLFHWHTHLPVWLNDFISGVYQFSPMIQYHFKDEVVRFWCYQDRVFIKLILEIIKPTFKHIIGDRYYHLCGPNGVKKALNAIKRALELDSYQYVIRADIKGYYASIRRQILLDQLNVHYQDPRLAHYFEQIVCVLSIKMAMSLCQQKVFHDDPHCRRFLGRCICQSSIMLLPSAKESSTSGTWTISLSSQKPSVNTSVRKSDYMTS